MITKLPKKDQKILEEIVQSTNIALAMNECLWLGNSQHKTLYVNPAFEKTSGYSLSECIGKDCVFFFDEEGKKIITHHHTLREKGLSSQYEASMQTKDGKLVPLLISGAPIGNGGTMGIFTNLTKVKELAQQEKLTRNIIQHTSEAIVVLNTKRRIKLWNDGATHLFGYKEKEVLNKSIDLIIPEQETSSNQVLLKEVQDKGFIKNIETRRQAKNGAIVDVTVSVTKVTGEKNEFIGYLVLYRDITHQKRANSELQKRFEAIQDAYKELGLQRRYIDYLSEVLDIGTSEKSSTQDLCRLIVSAFALLTKCDSAALRLYEKDRDILRLHSSFGVDAKWSSKDQIKFKNSIAQDAFKQKRALIINDVDSYRKHQGAKLLKAQKLKALILIPLYIEGRMIGSLSLYASDPSKFRLIETDFLEKMGKQCSLALFAKQILDKY